MRVGRWLAASLGAMLLSACATSGSPTPTFTPGDPLPESNFVPGPSASYMGLVLTGELVLGADGCVRLDPVVGSMASGITDILWPVGTTLRALPTGQGEIVWPDGTVVATTGEQLSASGGFTSHPAEPPCIGAGGVFQLEAVLEP
jgi:hypothetical protein